MASLIDIAALTVNPEEAQEIGKLIIEKALVQGELSEDHEIETGILYKTQIPFAGSIADSLKKADGCTSNVGTGVAMTEKYWEPEIYGSRFIHCAGDLNKLFKLFQKAQRINPEFYDRINSPEMGVIYALIERMLRETLPVKVWFSDKAAAIEPAGNFKTGTDLALYNVINGLFKQIFADATIPRVTITQNAAASYALQALPADSALGYLQAVVNKADSRMLIDATSKILVTRSIADNYRNSLRANTLGAGFLEVVEGGRPRLFFDNYEVKVRHDWDANILALEDNGTVLNKPHRIVMTTPSNIPVGTLSTDDLTTLDSFYDRTLKSNIVDVAFSLDAKFLESYMASVAY